MADALGGAVEDLLSEPFVRVEFEGTGDGYSTNGWVDLDLVNGDYHLFEAEEYEQSGPVISEYVLTGDIMNARIAFSEDGLEEEPFAAVPTGAQREDFVNETLTLVGRAGASLNRIAELAENLTFVHTEISAELLPEGVASGHQLEFVAADISRYFRDNDLEFVGPEDHDGSTFYEFWVAETGHLARIAIAGVQFHDGEALDDFGGAITYQPQPVSKIESPKG